MFCRAGWSLWQAGGIFCSLEALQVELGLDTDQDSPKRRRTRFISCYLNSNNSVADPHHFDADADPGPACYFDADPDPTVPFTLMGIPIRVLSFK
jgi:hypothetical protein